MTEITPTPNIAVLLSCHGTVDDENDIPAFVSNIRRGRPAPQEVLDEVRHRFRLIGGSPMMQITHRQAAALQERLGIPVQAAARLWHPYPKEVLADWQAKGIRRLVSLPLAPQSTFIYNAVVEKAAAEFGMEVVAADSWGLEPKLVQAFHEAIMEAYAQCEVPSLPDKLAILLTAHSLPKAIIDRGDPYERDFRAMAHAVAESLAAGGLAHPCRMAFQSQGMGGGEWLGPDLPETFKQLRTEGVEQILVAPIGFLAEHVETLFDIDIEAQQLAKEAGLKPLVRMPALNTRVAFIDALEQVARGYLTDLG